MINKQKGIEQMYSIKELVELGIGSSSSIYRWIDQGLLIKTKVGKLVRFKESDVNEFLKRGKE